MIKFAILLRRRPGLTHVEFVDYHRHHHAPLFASSPTTLAPVSCATSDAASSVSIESFFACSTKPQVFPK